MSENKFGINIVSKKTGLTVHAIRAWEKRYSAVTPLRTPTNRRMFTQNQIQRLRNLKILTDSGHSIGEIAGLTDLQLTELVEDLQKHTGMNDSNPNDFSKSYNKYFEQSIVSIQNFDSDNLLRILSQTHIKLGTIGLLNKLLVPLMEKIGELWREGSLRISHEHFASNVIRSFIGQYLNSSRAFRYAPNIIVATPSGQMHELGAILAACTAATEGWNVKYMGTDLPSEEIAGAVAANNSKAVALSVVYPNFDSSVLDDLKRLTKLLPEDVTIIIGGRASANYKPHLSDANIRFINSLTEFRNELEKLTNIDHMIN